MEAGPALLVASGYVGAISGVLERALTQLDAENIRDGLPEELVAALVDLTKAHARLQKVLSANIDEALTS